MPLLNSLYLDSTSLLTASLVFAGLLAGFLPSLIAKSSSSQQIFMSCLRQLSKQASNNSSCHKDILYCQICYRMLIKILFLMMWGVSLSHMYTSTYDKCIVNFYLRVLALLFSWHAMSLDRHSNAEPHFSFGAWPIAWKYMLDTWIFFWFQKTQLESIRDERSSCDVARIVFHDTKKGYILQFSSYFRTHFSLNHESNCCQSTSIFYVYVY